MNPMEDKKPFEYGSGNHNSGGKQTQKTFTKEDWQQLCSSIGELGRNMAEEMGVSFLLDQQKEGQGSRQLEELGKNISQEVQQAVSSVLGADWAHTSKAAPKAPAYQRPKGMPVQANSPKTQSIWNGLKNRLVDFTYLTTGTTLWLLAILFLIPAFVKASWVEPGLVILSLAFCVGSGLGGWWMFRQPKLRLRRRRYLDCADRPQGAGVEELAELVQRTPRFVTREIVRLIRKGRMPGAYFDREEQRLFAHLKDYRALQQRQAQQSANQENQAQACAQGQEAAPQNQEAAALQGQIRDFLQTVGTHIQLTHQEPALQQELLTMHGHVSTMLAWLEHHPESTPKARRLGSYYMPAIRKLLGAYDEVREQQSQVAQQIRLEITGMLHTMNTAFVNLQDELLSNTALDISAEISVMQSMLAKDGLAAEDTIFSKE